MYFYFGGSRRSEPSWRDYGFHRPQLALMISSVFTSRACAKRTHLPGSFSLLPWNLDISERARAALRRKLWQPKPTKRNTMFEYISICIVCFIYLYILYIYIFYIFRIIFIFCIFCIFCIFVYVHVRVRQHLRVRNIFSAALTSEQRLR